MSVLSEIVFREGENFGRLTALKDFYTSDGVFVPVGSFGGMVHRNAVIEGELWCSGFSCVEEATIKGDFLTSATVTLKSGSSVVVGESFKAEEVMIGTNSSLVTGSNVSCTCIEALNGSEIVLGDNVKSEDVYSSSSRLVFVPPGTVVEKIIVT